MRFEKRMCADPAFHCVSIHLAFSNLFVLANNLKKEKNFENCLKTEVATHESESILREQRVICYTGSFNICDMVTYKQ